MVHLLIFPSGLARRRSPKTVFFVLLLPSFPFSRTFFVLADDLSQVLLFSLLFLPTPFLLLSPLSLSSFSIFFSLSPLPHPRGLLVVSSLAFFFSSLSSRVPLPRPLFLLVLYVLFLLFAYTLFSSFFPLLQSSANL